VNDNSDPPRSADGSRLFKVAFDLDLERPAWPPVSTERLWGEKTGVKFEIRIINTPFFVRGIAFGDFIRIRPDNERRELVFEGLTAESGHSAIRIIFIRGAERVADEDKISEGA
jgi:hypothetical protein